MRNPVSSFRNASIKNKLIAIILAISAAILFLTAAMSLAQTGLAGWQRLHRILEVNANLMGGYCVVPLSFDDREEADRMLSRIQLIPGMVAAILYDRDGKVFASHNPSGLAPAPLEQAPEDPYAMDGSRLRFQHAVVHRDRPLGTIVLYASTRPLIEEILGHAAILAGMFALLILITYLLALRMQRLISRPLLDLAEATRRVSEHGDLSQRVHWEGKDEIGILYRGYNEMLEQLQSRLRERDQAEAEARLHQQQLLQAGKMVTLGTLVSGVAHEINNPNAYIMLSASLALKKWNLLPHRKAAAMAGAEANTGAGAGAEAVAAAGGAAGEGNGVGPVAEGRRQAADPYAFFPEILENIYRASQRIDAIVKKLKDYYRKDQARAKESVDMNEVVVNATEILDAKIRPATRNFRFLPESTLPAVLGSFNELEQVAIILIENACQALRNPDGTITVRTCRQVDGAVVLQVEDTGVGIPKDCLERITDPFFTTKRETGGTGLGLSLALSIVSDHGGSMRFESNPGAGTVATVMLPALAGHEFASPMPATIPAAA